MVILGIGAHPDDLELQCYGTMAKYVKQGDAVVVSSVANGNLGHVKIMPDELGIIRKKEAENAAKSIGAEYYAIDVGDLKVSAYDEMAKERVIELIRFAKPDVIVTHSPDDYMPDHVETSKLVFSASFGSSIPHIETKSACYDPVVPIYYMENASGIGFLPDEYVDITDTYDIKIEAMKNHKSQITWLDDHDGFDVFGYIRVAAEYRGIQSGVKYAESFKRCDVWPRIQTSRVLP